MNTRSARGVGFVATLLLLAIAPAAHAAVEIGVPTGCVYGSSPGTPQTIPYDLTGLAPGAPFTVSLGGKVRDSGTAKVDGTASGEFAAPDIHHGVRTETATVQSNGATASQRIDLTDFDAAITPSGGASTRAVRIALYGWVGKTVFLHYLAPHSKTPYRTIRITKTGGKCGHARARLAHLFPTAISPGSWRLIFDTSRKYHSNTKLRIEYDIDLH
jgi:hypothetical protein